MIKCPFCAEDIQDEAVKCKHCGEFLDCKMRERPSLWSDRVRGTFGHFRKAHRKLQTAIQGYDENNPLQIPGPGRPVTLEGVVFDTDRFTQDSRTLNYEDVTRLMYQASISSWNAFSTTIATICAEACDPNNAICIFKWKDGFRARKHLVAVKNAYAILQPRTQAARWRHYVTTLLQTGIFQYSDQVVIYSDGRLQHKSHVFDIRKALDKQSLSIGTQRRRAGIGPVYQTNPFRMMISDEGVGVFDRKSVFDCHYDTDIFPDLLMCIARGELEQSLTQQF